MSDKSFALLRVIVPAACPPAKQDWRGGASRLDVSRLLWHMCHTARHGKGKQKTSAHESITGAAQSGLPISTITVYGRQPQSARLCSSGPAKPRSARIRGKPIPRPILFASSRTLYCLVPPGRRLASSGSQMASWTRGLGGESARVIRPMGMWDPRGPDPVRAGHAPCPARAHKLTESHICVDGTAARC